MKVKFTKLAALLLAGAALFATGCTDYEVDIQKNADAIASANSQISALQTAIQALQSTHSTDVATLNKAISDLQTALNSAVADLDKKLDKTTFEAAKKELEAAIQGVKDRVKALEDANFQKQIDDLSAEVAKMATKEELAKAVTDLTTLINGEVAKLDARIKAIEETIPGMQEQIKKLEEAVAQHDETLASHAETIKLLTDAVNELAAICATKEELKEAVDGIMKTLEDDYVTKEALQKVLDEILAELGGAIRSLVFVPEVYVDGVEAILVGTLNYSPLALKDTNKVSEYAFPEDTTLTVTPAVIAKYHVIPSDADLSFLEIGDTVDFVVRPNDPFKTIRTRAEASEDFAVTGIYQGRDSLEADVIKIEVKVTGTPATEDLISVIALQLSKGDELYTSDYATVFSEDLDDIRIADPTNEEDAHYRRAYFDAEPCGISVADEEAFISDLPAWTEEFDTLSCDHQMVYDAEFDVKEYVIAHFVGEEDCAANEKLFEGLGFTWKFELVENYDFCNYDVISLSDDGVLTCKDGNAINSTPIVRVTILDGENNVQIAYVKVWVAPSDKEADIIWSKDPLKAEILDQFEFKCEGDTLVADSTDLYKQVYNLFPISRTNFDAAYPTFVDAVDPEVDTLGTVAYDPETGELTWIMTAEELWPIASDPNLKEGEIPVITHNVAFEAINGAQVVVTLKADVKPMQAYKVPIDRYIESYWTRGWDPENGKDVDDDIEKDYALYNVFTPGAGETDPDKCIFENNINAAFITDESGVIELGEYKYKDGTVLPAIGEPGLEVSNISYYFCKDMEKVTKIGDIDVKFEVPAGDSLNLYATITVDEEEVRERIAYIDNEGEGTTPNLVYLDKESDVAKILLNTMKELKTFNGKEYPMPGELFIYISAKGILCGDESGEGGFEVNLFWPENAENEDVWVDHFKAKYRQPVYLSDNAADAFIDAVDFGEGGSFINIKELLNPKDWRARPFEPQKDKNFVVIPDQVDQIDYFSNYWQYYGPITVEVDTTAITCNLGPDGKEMDLPVTIIVKAPVMKDDLLSQIIDPTRAYREKDGSDSGMTIEEKLDSVNDMIDDETEAGFLTYKNNGTNVTKDYELYIPVKLNYGWGTISKTITVKVYKTTDSFQKI